jgi:RimJ/RimL family protein N-acetyltransferase
MQILARYGFEMLGLKKISLNVYGFNQRAIRVYEKMGFKKEGCVKEFLNRDGQRWDLIFMGLLREEWLSHDTGSSRGEQ